MPIDNNWIENQNKSIPIGRGNRLFADGSRANHRAAAVMSLIQSVLVNGQDTYLQLRDVMAHLALQRADEIVEAICIR